jgi:hypothetical protein
VGAATAQSSVDSTGQNRVFIRDHLALGVAPQDIITQLATFDAAHQSRQYGIVDYLGRTATFSGTGDGQWAGGQTGQFDAVYLGQVGTIAYAIQGNVLTGQPVVDMAVQAVITTPGDLPAKLMAAMQAARSMGGDGRCSCNPSNPTGCGSPPPSFTKSAHIAYMLIARAGDSEGCNGIYRAGTSSAIAAAVDLAGDSFPDLIVSNASSSNVSLLTNLSGGLPAQLAPVFTSLPTNSATGSGPRGMAFADFDGDLLRDVATANTGANTVSILRGLPGGGLGPATSIPAGGTPRAITTGDFDGVNGPDLATANFSNNTVSILLNNGSGGFGSPTTITVDTGPYDIAAANLVGSPALDLAVMARTANKIDILRGNGDGTFVLDQTLTTDTSPSALIATDLDGDGNIDLAVSCDTAHTVQVFLNNGGVFTPTSYTVTFNPTALAAGDTNGDGRKDIVTVGQGAFSVFRGVAGGGFALHRTYSVMAAVFSAALVDLDNDGDLDLIMTTSGGGGVVTVKNRGPGPLLGVFNDGLGCATGDYFMNFNVANQLATDPDPVIQLQGLYNQWRSALVGRPDAVQSRVTFNPPYLPSVGAPQSTMTISLRDWQGLATTATIQSVIAAPAPGSPALTTIGPVQPQGNGVFTVLLTGGSTAGLEHFRITVDDGVRPVILMPDPAISIFQGSCYANCDGSTTPPVLNVADYACFMNRFAAADPYANCDGSTTPPALNIADFVCFMQTFAAGCP